MRLKRGNREQLDRIECGVLLAMDARHRMAQGSVGGRRQIAAGLRARARRALVLAFARTAAMSQRSTGHHAAGKNGPCLSRQAQQYHQCRDELPDAHKSCAARLVSRHGDQTGGRSVQGSILNHRRRGVPVQGTFAYVRSSEFIR